MRNLLIFLALALPLSAQPLTLQQSLNSNAVVNTFIAYGGHSDGAVLANHVSGTYYEFNQHNKSVMGIGMSHNAPIGFMSYYRVLNGSTASVDLAGVFDDARALSATLAAYNGFRIDTSDMNNIKVMAADGVLNAGFLTFELDARDVTGNRTMDFSGLNPDVAVLINVFGGDIDWSWTLNAPPSQFIWNFVDGGLNVLTRDFAGLVLAVDEDVVQHRNINGTVIAKTLTVHGSSELHSYKFIDEITQSVPEPNAFLILVLGVALILRNRSRDAF